MGRNALRAGLPPDAIRCSRCDVLQARPPFDAPGVIVTNPPYGERLELHAPARRSPGIVPASGLEAWMGVGRALKDRFGGWRLWMLTSDLDLPRHLNMKARRRTPLYNGAIECRLFGFEIFGPVEAASPEAAAPEAPAPDARG